MDISKRTTTYQRVDEAITGAFFLLLENHDFHKITVSQIIEKAGVNRTTFYRHYEDKYAILDNIKEMAQPLGERMIMPFINDDRGPFDIMFNTTYLQDNVPEYYKKILLLLLKVRSENFDMERIVKDGFASHYNNDDDSETTELKRQLYVDICYRMLIYALTHEMSLENANGHAILDDLFGYISKEHR